MCVTCTVLKSTPSSSPPPSPPPSPLPSRSSSASTKKSLAVCGQGRSRTLRRRGRVERHCAAHRRFLAVVADSRLACAADGGSGRGAAEVRHAVCRAGIAVPKISFDRGPTAFCRSSSAEGRTVGGSADRAWICPGCPCLRRFFFEARTSRFSRWTGFDSVWCRAHRRFSWSTWRSSRFSPSTAHY